MTHHASPESTTAAAYGTLWQELIAQALSGTARQPLRLPSPDAPVTALLARLDPAEPERAMLSAAAVLSLYRQAGRLPPVDHTPAPTPCPPDTQPVCTPQAAEHLALMLDNVYSSVLPEWLAAVAAAGQRVPDRHLVSLLELGQKQADLRAAILPVLGQRGRWLATQNPAWEYARPLPAAEELLADAAQLHATWETSDRATRQALLTRLREQSPFIARTLVETTWGSEKADDRAAFVATFATGLSMDDEPFLEAALDDRSREVRRTAANLLSRLPASRLVQRMIARVQPLVIWNPPRSSLPIWKSQQQARIDVTLPDVCDKSMIRDGIEPKPPHHLQIGERAWWLQQLISAIPLIFWTQTWNTPPAVLISAACLNAEWGDLLLDGWTTAARNQRDQAWIDALLTTGKIMHTTEELLHLLSPEQREAHILNVLQTHAEPLQSVHPAFALLIAHRSTWSFDLTRAVLASLRQRTARQATSDDYELRSLLPIYALRMSPELLASASTGWPTDSKHWSFWADAVEHMLAVLRFRHDMLKEFAK